MRAIMISVFGLLAVAGAAHAQDWKPYVNQRIGFTMDAPVAWKADAPAGDGLSASWKSPDGKGSIVVRGSFLSGVKLNEVFDAVGEPDDSDRQTKITYAQKGAHQLTLSGTKGAAIFYNRFVGGCGDQTLATLEITYPAAQKADYDALVSHIAGSFRAGKAQGMNCP